MTRHLLIAREKGLILDEGRIFHHHQVSTTLRGFHMFSLQEPINNGSSMLRAGSLAALASVCLLVSHLAAAAPSESADQQKVAQQKTESVPPAAGEKTKAWTPPEGIFVNGEAHPPSQAEKKVLERFKKANPDVPADGIRPTPMSGIYEISFGQQVAYINGNPNYLLMGHLINMRNHVDLTQTGIDYRHRVRFDRLPLKEAVKVVRGDGSRVFAVFSDPDCPYCRKLESELTTVTNYTMYVFLYPIASLHPQARMQADAIWCSADKSQAWTSYMAGKQDGPINGSTTCKTPIDDVQHLAEYLGVFGTPTMFNAKGQQHQGYFSGSEMEEFLSGGKQ